MAITSSQVDTAIIEVLGGQSYRIGDITYTRADLDKLRAFRNELLAEENAVARGSRTSRANFGDGL